MPIVFILLCAGLFTTFFFSGCLHTRDVWRNAADRQVVPTKSTTWKGTVAVIFAAVVFGAYMNGLHSFYESTDVRGTPRSIDQLQNGEYRVLVKYRTPGGTMALIAPIDGGEPIYYRLGLVPLNGVEYCFRRSRPDYRPVYTNVRCPPLESY